MLIRVQLVVLQQGLVPAGHLQGAFSWIDMCFRAHSMEHGYRKRSVLVQG